MADNLSQKLGKSSEKTKYSNAVNRTTSETMRLGEPEKAVNHPTSLISATPNQRKKTPSFQITSVTVGSRTSNDGGDDSADDLDESHTDDMSDVIDNSRITDIENETPSYSEDTFSKEDVFFNASTTSLGTAPVIPTSSQYGLAIVASEGGGNVINATVACANTISGNEVHVSVTDAGNVINIVGSVKPNETEMRDVHAHHAGRNERFKVVKIESTEPFKRGRWLCMDYLDHTMLQQQSQQAVINVVRSTDLSDNTTAGSAQYVGPDSGVVLTDGPLTLQSMDDPIINAEQSQLKSSAMTIQEQHQVMGVAQHQVTMAGLASGQSATGSSNFPSVSPGQTLQQVQQPGPVQPPQQHVSVTSQPHQGLQQQALPQPLSQSMQQGVSQQQMQQQSQGMSVAQVLQQQQQHHAQSMSQVPVQQNVAAGAPQQPQPVAQHQSLPPQQIQQVMAAANLQQMQQQQGLMPQQTQKPFPPQQNAGQQQMSSQSVPQGMIPAQPSQSQQHIISQSGQSQGQYYNMPSTTQLGSVPISQGQSGIQMVSQQPHTSITAQTQTMQTSTPNQIPSGITASQLQQPQTGTSMPLQPVTHHQIQPVTSQNQSMQPIGQPSVPQQVPSQTSQQHNIQQYAQQSLQQVQQTQQPVPQSQQAVVQPQQAMQQPQKPMSQQVMQQPQPQQTLQQSQQSIQPQVMPQAPQAVQQQMHHSANMQNVQQQQQQIHVGNLPGIAQQPGPAPMPAMVQGQGMIPASQGQNLITGHQMAMAGGQQVPQQAPQMVPVSSSVVTNIPGASQTFSHMPVNQVPIQTFPTLGPTTVSSRTIPSCTGTNSMSVGLDGTVDQGAGLGAANVIGGDPSVALLESLVEVTTNEDIQPGGVTAGEDAESASGTSAVAIDNKIEQAMDLVKSHLMFAVREEVEVLKEKIAELMDRINQLELENTILKAHASQETLAQLGGSTAQQGSKNQQSQQPPNGSMP
ncbi:protein bunched, class 2/F/G isoform isoform X2 [Cryptotermes secundus]|uniref:protein bunched, class 2/F/G isoform isoform X2 n=1 Tax=Cryptotermes secundus TaxID=105785 RepID=UPI000CD7D7B1|nr:protein bunched, class 2/F/G isoform isoform X2 [Cryptotermes secundus]